MARGSTGGLWPDVDGFYWGGHGDADSVIQGSKRKQFKRISPTTKAPPPGAIAKIGPFFVVWNGGEIANRYRHQGRVTSNAHREMVNQVMAQRLAAQMVKELQSGLRRPNVSTGRLAKALMDPQNMAATAYGFGVGNPNWLDRSPAKYWRAIEEGTTFFLGDIIGGMWGANAEGAQARPPWSGFGESTGGKYVRFNAEVGRYAAAENKKRRSAAIKTRNANRPKGSKSRRQAVIGQRGIHSAQINKSRFRTTGEIRVPIYAHNYMSDAWRHFPAREIGLQISKALLRDMMPTPKPR